jgi:hypothetical protein
MTSVSTAQTPEPPAGNIAPSHRQDAAAASPVSRPDADSAGPETHAAAHLNIAVADWDLMFVAVRTRLIDTVRERMAELPNLPQHPAELPASRVQAAVLDCVNALDQLHAALTRERSQRPTP